MTSNMDRIAALEATVKDLAARLAALEGEPPRRDPASTTNAVTERAPAATSRRLRTAPIQPFGFGKDVTA